MAYQPHLFQRRALCSVCFSKVQQESLTGQDSLPSHSWFLATLPISQGGLGILDLCLMAPILLLWPLTRSPRYSLHGVPVRLPFVSGKVALPKPSLWQQFLEWT
jgi:hypothetical protein